MGASLPVGIGLGRRDRRGALACGLLYGANTIGAVIGCVAAGFYLLRLFDVNVASGAAIVVNLSTASCVVVALSRALRARDLLHGRGRKAACTARMARSTILHSRWPCPGFAALGCGSCLDARHGSFARRDGVCLRDHPRGLSGRSCDRHCCASAVARVNARSALGWCQMLAAAGIAWTALRAGGFAAILADQSATGDRSQIHFSARSRADGLGHFAGHHLFWGASFPFAFAAAFAREPDRSAAVGAFMPPTQRARSSAGLWSAFRDSAAGDPEYGARPDGDLGRRRSVSSAPI